MKYDVSVQVINELYSGELEDMIKSFLNDGFKIQNSQVQWYCGRIEGVYVFIKELEEDNDE